MSKPVKAQTALPLTQAERLARKEFLKSDAARLELQLREVQEQMARLLDECEHTDANGRSALIGGRTKVCAHCGRVVAVHGAKLWG
jgi:hypothetical protein